MRSAAVATMCAVLFALGAAPGLTWLDAGELGAAAWELGVAHPPGFPVFLLLHKAVMLLLPVGDLAFRGNLASGFVGAAALTLLWRAGRRWGLAPVPLAAGIFVAATTPALALHAVTIEVYTGVGLFVAASLWLLARAPGVALDPRRAVAAGLLGGLASGHHAELRLLLLPLLLALWAATGWSRRALLGALAAGVVGALVVLYLPLRAATDPWRDWGHPASAGALWDHLAATRIRVAYADQIGQLTLTPALRFGAEVLAPQGPALWLGLPGLALLARRPGGATVLALLVVDALYAVLLNPMGVNDLQTGATAVLAVGLGFAAALDWAVRRAVPWRIGAGLVLLGALWGRLPFLRDTDRGLPALTEAALDSLPPGAPCFVASDNLAAGLAFAQVAEGARPDVPVLVRQHLWDASSVDPVARRLPALFEGWRPPAPLETLPLLRRPPESTGLGWEVALGVEGQIQPVGLWPDFPLFRPGARPLAEVEAAAVRFTERQTRTGGLVDRQARTALSHWFVDFGDATAAATAYDRAAALDPDGLDRIESRRAAAHARRGELVEAVGAALRAVEAAPDHRGHRLELARYTLNAGRAAEALPLLDALVEEAPQDADARALRGLAHAQTGAFDAAEADFTAALSLDPSQPEALYGRNSLRRTRR